MLQLTENRQFVARYVGTVAVIAWVIALVVGGLFDLHEFWEKPWPELGQRIWVGIRSLFFASVAAYIALTILNRWLWRSRAVSALMKIPDFSGRWEGWYRPTLTSGWRPTAHEISQRALDVSAAAWGPTNVSRSVSASIVIDSHGLLAELVWAYKTEWTAGQPRGGDAHSGVHLLRLCDHDGASYLEGRYINDRERQDGSLGAVGEIRVKRVSQDLHGCLNFNETGWGLPKPPDSAPVSSQ